MDIAVAVDASVWVSRLVAQDVNYAASRIWLQQYVAQGGHLIGPTILLSEVAGPIARRTGQPTLARQAITHLLTLVPLQLVPVDPVLGMLAARLAADLRLRGADAVYVALAYQLSIPLVTWDAEQLQRTVGQVATYTPDSYIF
jgi:predicted nucleic acid-binding protein